MIKNKKSKFRKKAIIVAILFTISTSFVQAQWTTQLEESLLFFGYIDVIDANTAWAVGQAGGIYATTDGGANWNKQTSNSTATIHGVSFVDANTGWVVGTGGTILHTSNGGSTWSTQTSNTSQSLMAIFFTNTNIGWAVGHSRQAKLLTN